MSTCLPKCPLSHAVLFIYIQISSNKQFTMLHASLFTEILTVISHVTYVDQQISIHEQTDKCYFERRGLCPIVS